MKNILIGVLLALAVIVSTIGIAGATSQYTVSIRNPTETVIAQFNAPDGLTHNSCPADLCYFL